MITYGCDCSTNEPQDKQDKEADKLCCGGVSETLDLVDQANTVLDNELTVKNVK